MNNRRILDTSQLGPISVAHDRNAEARNLYADAIAARGPAWRNSADSIRSGAYGNAWTEAAIVAINSALQR